MAQVKSYLPSIILLGSILFLWIMRWDSLTLPYFWDEMGVYGNGVQYLYQNGIGILPHSLPPELSRGHPLFFYTLHASVLKVFGNSLFVSHSFALLISSLTLISTYLLAKEFMSKIVAAGCVFLLLSQPIFMAQSGLVIPEMAIALISTLAILSFLKKEYLISALLLCTGVMIKESVILVAAFLGFTYLLQLLRTKQLIKSLTRLLIFTLPLFVFLIFLLIQKSQHGWYFFPYHTDIIQEGAFSGFWERLELHYKFMFFKQGRNQWLIAGVLSVLSIAFYKNSKKLGLLLAFFIVNLLVFSFAFYMDRYLLYLFPILVVIVGTGLYFISFKNPLISLLLLLLLSAFSLRELSDPSFRYDVSLAYEDVVQVQQDAADYLCDLPDEEISYQANFPVNMSLWGPSFGYLSEACLEKLHPKESAPEYRILFMQEDENMTLIHSIKKNDAIINIYN
jgi:4-amino-4-deoxy-L-arabinose transferase-like glycosyltransferase